MPILETQPRPTQRKKGAPEGRIQSECVKIAWNEYPETRGLYYAIPNENSRVDSNSATGAIRRSMGVVAGCADTYLAMARGGYFGLYIEFKSEIGRQRKEQVEFQQRVEQQGYKYVVVHSVEEWRKEWDEYLLMPPTETLPIPQYSPLSEETANELIEILTKSRENTREEIVNATMYENLQKQQTRNTRPHRQSDCQI